MPLHVAERKIYCSFYIFIYACLHKYKPLYWCWKSLNRVLWQVWYGGMMYHSEPMWWRVVGQTPFLKKGLVVVIKPEANVVVVRMMRGLGCQPITIWCWATSDTRRPKLSGSSWAEVGDVKLNGTPFKERKVAAAVLAEANAARQDIKTLWRMTFRWPCYDQFASVYSWEKNLLFQVCDCGSGWTDGSIHPLATTTLTWIND